VRHGRRPNVSVDVGVSYELLVLLYRQTQAAHELPAMTAISDHLVLPARLRPTADWFFRGDIALGMNIIPLAHERGWHDVARLLAGINGADPHELARAMLRPPDATSAERRRREVRAGSALGDVQQSGSLLAEFEAERFDVSAVKGVFEDPVSAVQAFVELIGEYARLIGPYEEALLGPLTTAGDGARELLDELSFAQVAQRLFPQWKLDQPSGFEEIVLIPSQAIAPFLSSRVVAKRYALIVFPVPPERGQSSIDLATALKALGHPQRLEMLRIAAAAPITGHALARAMGLTEATVHHHTSLLRAAGLMTSTRDAQRVYHSARLEALDRLFEDTRLHLSHSPFQYPG